MTEKSVYFFLIDLQTTPSLHRSVCEVTERVTSSAVQANLYSSHQQSYNNFIL